MSFDSPYFGIDFGTTNSSMAWYNPQTNQAETILNSEGEPKTPSLVYFGEDGTLVGKPVETLLEDSDSYEEAERADIALRVVRSIKRNLKERELELSPETAAGTEREVMGDTIEGVIARQEERAIV